jgi:predicted phage-related endonuclease
MEAINFDRTKGLGGSDIPALLGFSPWKTPMELYLEKLGDIKEDALNTRPKTKHILNMGKMLEPYVIQSFQEDSMEVITRQQERVYHPEHKFLWGTIDGMCNGLVVEVKTTASYVEGWKNDVPVHVLSQVAYYSNLLNSAGAKIIVLFRDNGDIRTYEYRRDLSSEEHIIRAAVEFWHNVTTKNPPSATSYKEAQILFKNVIQDKKVIASSEDLAVVEKMRQLKNEIEKKEEEYDALKLGVCNKLGNASMLEDALGNCLATWKERNCTRLNIEDLKQDQPNIYSKYLARSTTRNFSLKTNEQYAFV